MTCIAHNVAGSVKSTVWIAAVCAAALCGPAMLGQDTAYAPQGEQIPGPKNPAATEGHCCAQGREAPLTAADQRAWLDDLRQFRRERLIRAGFKDDDYRRKELDWTKRAFIQPQVMIEDRFLYDPSTRHYTVKRYLEDLERRYGGIDAVLLWHTYPNIGIDSRNQYDRLRDMPGGIEGVRAMIAEFHRYGVRVLFPVMLWDQGTREEGVPNAQATARVMAAIGADGVNGDTLAELPLPFREAAERAGHPLGFEPEGAPRTPGEALTWNTMSWGYWKYPFEPMVSLYKWLEPRHMVNVCDRWAREKTDDLQAAFFNGAGYESWENIWGIWNQIDDRDAEAIRRIALIERAMAPMLVSADWEPYAPMLQYGAFASRFPLNGETLWMIVNRNEFSLDGPEIEVPAESGMRYYDLWNGVELQPETRGGKAELHFAMEGHGFGAVLATPALSGGASRLMERMRALSVRPLASYSKQWHVLTQRLVPIAPTTPKASPPPGMVAIPAADYEFRVSGVEIEGGNDTGVDVQYPWEDSPRRQHVHQMHIPRFAIDRHPVTNSEFGRFLAATNYQPADDHNFLRDWQDGKPRPGWENKPVTWVSLEDARAYAKWAGKRLPHEWEWQYAAQGADGRAYPWGSEWDASRMPAPDKERTMAAPADVGSERGASPFGVADLTGGVWQWTDEYIDDHTRAAVLRGGSYYQPQGSKWYFPQAYRLDEHGKYLLMSPGMDRSGAIGFRCVADLE
jgi:iron(II)-dependent oxidoreductase